MLPDHVLSIYYDEACRQRAIDVNTMKGIFSFGDELSSQFKIHGKRTIGFHEREFDALKELLGG